MDDYFSEENINLTIGKFRRKLPNWMDTDDLRQEIAIGQLFGNYPHISCINTLRSTRRMKRRQDILENENRLRGKEVSLEDKAWGDVLGFLQILETPETILLQKERKEIVNSLVDSLPYNQRETILSFMHEMIQRETAERMGYHESRLSQFRRQAFRTLLKGYLAVYDDN